MVETVVVDYEDLLAPVGEQGSSFQKKLEQAFGASGYGLICIRGVPNFVEAKRQCLNQGYPLANLPAKDLLELEDPKSMYNAGWSHGKEKLKKDTPDLAKASFYFNPIVDVPGTEEDRQRFPASYPSNKWPTKSLPELETTAKRLGCIMKDVAVHLAKHLDVYAHSLFEHYPPTVLHSALKDTDKVKGRLLYYYPLLDSSVASEDSWIGFHNDSGYITALAGDIYLDPDGNILPGSPSNDTGLYVEDRNESVCKIDIPGDCMAIQIGECAQIITGGALVATPHCVKGAHNVARVSLACFIDVPPSTPLSAPIGVPRSAILSRESARVPPLSARWENGMTFGDFLRTTFQMYYDWK